MRIKPIYPHFNMGHVVEDYREGGGGVGSETTWRSDPLRSEKSGGIRSVCHSVTLSALGHDPIS
jgi:hypothetical protein